MPRQQAARSPLPELSGAADGRALQLQRRLIALALLAAGALAGCDVTLAHGLAPEEADDIASVLGRRGIAANKLEEDSGKHYRIEIAASSVEVAVAALSARATAWPNTDESEDDAPLVPTRRDQRLRENRALGLALARTIELLPGVVRARVHVSAPETDPNMADPNPAPPDDVHASVLLLLRVEHRPDVSAQVRHLLAGAVAGLHEASVTVVESVRPDVVLPCAAMARVGPIQVAAASVNTLKSWLFAGLCLHMLLALALLLVLRRERNRALEPDD